MHAAGCPVLVLEARDRVGGRTLAIPALPRAAPRCGSGRTGPGCHLGVVAPPLSAGFLPYAAPAAAGGQCAA
ncbi:FAD-dependent oxidoreductase [Hymenobacter terricola]|uniref:FAD-dependent oxidoreductase n=1 Tax=Hymenobacter terricola TaxID=2819236 RepID=UPI001CF3A031